MADEADIAGIEEERARQRHIDAARRAATESVLVRGEECLNTCGSAPAPDSPWCCTECRDDFESRKAAARRNGTP